MNEPYKFLEAEIPSRETDLVNINKQIKESHKFKIIIYSLNLFVVLFGFGVAVNYISKITSEPEFSSTYYEIPAELYKSIDTLKDKVSFISLLLIFSVFLQFVFFLVLVFKS